eukprot:895027-Prymnesium_polylepis.1
MATRQGTLSRSYVGRDPRKEQGEIPGAEKSAPALSVIPSGHAKKVPNRAPTYVFTNSASPVRQHRGQTN